VKHRTYCGGARRRLKIWSCGMQQTVLPFVPGFE
jgi:hypothetical protein